LPSPLSHPLLSRQLRRTNFDDLCNRWVGVLGIRVSGLSKSKSSPRENDLRINHGRRRFDLDASRRRHRRSIAYSFPWLLLLGVGNRNADGMSDVHCDTLHSIPGRMAENVSRNLFLTFK